MWLNHLLLSPQIRKVLFSQLTHLLMFDPTRPGHHDPGSSVMSLDIIHKVVSVDRSDVLDRPQNGPTQWGALVGGGVKIVENNFLKVHFHFLHFAQDHAAFAFDFLQIVW